MSSVQTSSVLLWIDPPGRGHGSIATITTTYLIRMKEMARKWKSQSKYLYCPRCNAHFFDFQCHRSRKKRVYSYRLIDPRSCVRPGFGKYYNLGSITGNSQLVQSCTDGHNNVSISTYQIGSGEVLQNGRWKSN